MLRNQFISCQRHLLSCFSVTMTLLASLQLSAYAQTVINLSEPTEINQLSIPQKLTIPPIAASEITSDVKAESVGNERDLLAPPRFNAVLVREFPGLWQMRVPIEQLPFLYATYDLKANNGQNNAFSNQDRDNETLKVVLEPLPIIEVSRDPQSNTVLIQGGVRLRMDLSQAQSAGIYSGDVTVTINQR